MRVTSLSSTLVLTSSSRRFCTQLWTVPAYQFHNLPRVNFFPVAPRSFFASNPRPMNQGNQGNQPQQMPQQGQQTRSQAQIPTIQLKYVGQFVQALQKEAALAQAATNEADRAKHYAKVESLRQILKKYQTLQQNARQQEQNQMNPQQTPQGSMNPRLSTGNPGASQIANRQAASPVPQSMPQNLAAQRQNAGPGGPASGGGPPQSGSSSGTQGSAPALAVSAENLKRINTVLTELSKQINDLEARKANGLSADQAANTDNQLNQFRSKFAQYQKVAVYMKGQLERGAQGSSPASAGSPAVKVGTPAMGGATAGPDPRLRPGSAQGAGSPALTRSAGSPQGDIRPGTPSGGIGSSGRSASPPASGKTNGTPSKTSPNQTPGPPAINLSGITKPSVSSMPISNTINVKPPAAVTLKPNPNNRPTLAGGVANGIGQLLGTPSVLRMPTYDLSNTGGPSALPDNGGRVLTKRKLSELVNSIGADEGDGKTTIDGDVEELLLDLADEFISSVTGFACRLAKHRKVDSVDVKDIQLHLERNWNIRIPGYAMDEIRSTRKWQPTQAYNQKKQGVEISKSVN